MSPRVRRLLAFAAAALSWCTSASAQTSWGVAVTAANDIVFCDVRRDRVWRLARDGALTDIRPDTHCRGLVLGPDGFVYGESANTGTTVDASTGNARPDTLGIWRVGISSRPAWVQPPVAAPEPSMWIVIDGQGRSYGWNGALPPPRPCRKSSGARGRP